MSLDKQRILSELGSVMNQLKSADCGCMGKLFSNQNQGAAMGAPLPTCGGCRRGCCHGHGYSYGAASAGEPHSMGNNMNHSMNPCMGHCNPPKLYADTYSYLNNNLMQPVVKEVYNDLKSINPENTVMNSPLGNQMGLPHGNTGAMAQGNSGLMGSTMQNMPAMDTGNSGAAMGQSSPPMNPLGGMGPQIVNMIMGDSAMKSNGSQGIQGQGGQPTSSMVNAPQTSPGQTGAMNNMSMNPATGSVNYPGNMTGFANPQTQFVSKENLYSMGGTQDNRTSNLNQGARNTIIPQIMGNVNQGTAYSNSAQMGNMASNNLQMENTNPNVQQMTSNNLPQYGQNTQGMIENMNAGSPQTPPANKPNYGQHTQGVMKFNEMFPGVMQGGDLGFDPMAIAIQMNPANQQKAAMDTMQRLMTGGQAGRLDTAANAAAMKPVMNATKNAVESISNPVPATQVPQNQQLTGQQSGPPAQTNQKIVQPGQQPVINQAGQYTVPQQQVYAVATGQPTFNQQQYQQQQLQQPMLANQQPSNQNQQYQQQNQLYVDPNTGATFLPGKEGSVDPNSESQPSTIQAAPQISTPPQQTFKEPIFPADTSRNRPYTYTKPHEKHYDFNTLGQPIEMLPAKMFHPPEPSLPQTLSPQPPTTKLRNDYLRFSNVKSTVSKTSLAGIKPIGRAPSRSQLHHIYNQYKGSQSFTQQNLRTPVQGATFSEGNIPPISSNPAQQIPVERVGGDTVANNEIVNSKIPNKAEQVMGQVGDVPAINKPQGDGAPVKPPSSPAPSPAKLRNGLQDVVYTSYPSSAAWSFHGTNTYRPVSVGYRFRKFK